MDDLLRRLKPKERRGSKPRCHLLTHGPPDRVAARLTLLIAPFGSVSPADRWMPVGFDAAEEAQLDRAPQLIDAGIGRALREWWLAVDNPESKTPNFDIAATCTIDGEPGILLVEAKAHPEELIREEAGKRERRTPTKGSRANHARIGKAIGEANAALRGATGPAWNLSLGSRYQMSNRFAWGWKLATMGKPVILVYLGFLGCDDMRCPFDDPLT